MIGKKLKIKGGLLSDIVSLEEFEKMTSASAEENTDNKDTEIKPAADTTPAENNNDASWKSRTSEPAVENTDDGNQGCKKASNQNEYADEIGLVEVDIDEELPAESVISDMLDDLDGAFRATDEIIEQKMIMDEAAKAGNLSVASIAIFKQNAERYMVKMHGEGKGAFDGKFIDPDNSGLQSDNPESLKAGLQGVWDSIVQTVQDTIIGLEKAGGALDNIVSRVFTEINTKNNKTITQAIWYPFKKSIESSANKDKKLIISKGAVNDFTGLNYIFTKMLAKGEDISKEDFINIFNEAIDFNIKDKLPEVSDNSDGTLDMLEDSMGKFTDLEKKISKVILDAIKKGEDGKTIFGEIFKSEFDRSMEIGGTTNLLKTNMTKKGYNPNDIKPEQVRAYNTHINTIYAIVFSADGKNYLHDFKTKIPYNFLFNKSQNVSANESLEFTPSEVNDMIAKIDEGFKALTIENRNKQAKKISNLNKILKKDIAELKKMVSSGEMSNWKLWKQKRQDLFSIVKVYPQLIRTTANGLHLCISKAAVILARGKMVD